MAAQSNRIERIIDQLSYILDAELKGTSVAPLVWGHYTAAVRKDNKINNRKYPFVYRANDWNYMSSDIVAGSDIITIGSETAELTDGFYSKYYDGNNNLRCIMDIATCLVSSTVHEVNHIAFAKTVRDNDLAQDFPCISYEDHRFIEWLAYAEEEIFIIETHLNKGPTYYSKCGQINDLSFIDGRRKHYYDGAKERPAALKRCFSGAWDLRRYMALTEGMAKDMGVRLGKALKQARAENFFPQDSQLKKKELTSVLQDKLDNKCFASGFFNNEYTSINLLFSVRM